MVDMFDLDSITLEDALRFYHNGKRLTLNDGIVVDIIMEEEIESRND